MSTEHPKTCKDIVAASAAKRSEHRNDNIDKNGANTSVKRELSIR